MKKIVTLLLVCISSCAVSYAARIWPIALDNQISETVQNNIVGDFRPNDVDNHLYIWSSGETYNIGEGGGLNFFGHNDGYWSFVVAAPDGWSGMGLCIENPAAVTGMQKLQEAIVSTPDSIYLHIAIKSTTQGNHQFYIFQNSNTSFAIGTNTIEQGQVIGDFPRDGQWYDFYIPMAQFASAVASSEVKSNTNILCILSGSQTGAQLDLDAIYFCDLDFKEHFDEYTCKDKYNVSITAGEHGSLTKSKEGILTTCDTHTFCTEAIPDEGCHFVKWSDGYGIQGRCININSDTTIVAIFAKGEVGGMLGEALYWSYEADKRQITVSGNGEMTEHGYSYVGYFEERYNLEGMITEKILVEEGATNLSRSIFKSLRKLQSADLAASIERIDESAFEDCRSLSQVTFATGSSLTTIGDWAFYNCHELASIAIPEGVTTIGKAAFYGCAYMQQLALPASLRQMDDNAFALCSRLQKITVDAIVPPAIAEKTFFEVNPQTPVYVPEASVSAYKADQYWGRMNIVGAETPVVDATADAPAIRKQLINGQLLIIRNGHTYTVQGQQLQ